MNRRPIAAAALLALVATACGSSSHSSAPSTTTTAPKSTTTSGATSTTVAPSVQAVMTNIGGSVSGAAGKEPVIHVPTTPAPTQVETHDLLVGTGQLAKPDSSVEVRYVGVDYKTGKVFDASWTSGTAPVSFSLASVIPGFAAGITGMKVGGRREIVIPPKYGYGANASGPITANETLVFVVDLAAVTVAPHAVEATLGGSVTGPSGKQPVVVPPTAKAPTQVTYHDVVVGQGTAAGPTSTAVVQYVALDYATGKVFDTSWTKGTPVSFPLASVIPGLGLGIAGMKPGGRREIVIPPSAGYGSAGHGSVKPNETIIFVVDLVSVS